MHSPETRVPVAPLESDGEMERRKKAEKIKNSLNDPGYQDFLIVGLQNKKIAAQLAADEARRNDILTDLEASPGEEDGVDEKKPGVSGLHLEEQTESVQDILKSLFKRLTGGI